MKQNYRMLWRGKCIDTGKWFVGSYFVHDPPPMCFASDSAREEPRHLIVWNGFSDWNMPVPIKITEVDPLTVGQCTGMVASRSYRGESEKDCLVFEGDRVEMHQFLFDGREIENELTGVIGYKNESASFTLKNIAGKEYEIYTGFHTGESESEICIFYGLHDESWTITGTIHDENEKNE